MDAPERRVLRWKRDLLSANIIFDQKTVAVLKSRGLLWDSLITEINETETKNCEKVWKFLDHLTREKLEKDAFSTFCEFLDEEHPWISSELRVEVSLERGQMKIDDYIKNEASTLIHRHFGSSKRISEPEKKQLEILLATRTQCTKNIWIKNVEQTKQALNEQISLARDRDILIKTMITKIQVFLESESEIVNFWNIRSSVDKPQSAISKPIFKSVNLDFDNQSDFSLKEIMTQNNDLSPMTNRQNNTNTNNNITNIKAFSYLYNEILIGKSLNAKMEMMVERLMEFSKRSFEQYEHLRDEKNRVFEILENRENYKSRENATNMLIISGKNNSSHLDREEKRSLLNLTDQLKSFDIKLAEKIDRIHDLELLNLEMKKQFEENLKERDKNIRFLATSLEESRDDAVERENELIDLKKQLKFSEDRYRELEIKLNYIEKHRQYGYWYHHGEDYSRQRMRNINIDQRPHGWSTRGVTSTRKLIPNYYSSITNPLKSNTIGNNRASNSNSNIASKNRAIIENDANVDFGPNDEKEGNGADLNGNIGSNVATRSRMSASTPRLD